MSAEATRPSAGEIYERVTDDARAELARPARQLAWSGLLSGATIGFSGLAAALVSGALAGARGATLAGAVAYPVGFVAVIVGRAQLFTENTLYPVALVLRERRHVGATLRLWAVVFAANTAGTALFALLATQTEGVPHEARAELARMGKEVATGGFPSTFWSALIAGWLLALVAWLVEAVEQSVGQVLVIWALTFVVGLGAFDHSVASTAEVLAATFDGDVAVGHAIGWMATAALGNTLGGVVIVALFNYAQTRG